MHILRSYSSTSRRSSVLDIYIYIQNHIYRHWCLIKRLYQLIINQIWTLKISHRDYDISNQRMNPLNAHNRLFSQIISRKIKTVFPFFFTSKHYNNSINERIDVSSCRMWSMKIVILIIQTREIYWNSNALICYLLKSASLYIRGTLLLIFTRLWPRE